MTSGRCHPGEHRRSRPCGGARPGRHGPWGPWPAAGAVDAAVAGNRRSRQPSHSAPDTVAPARSSSASRSCVPPARSATTAAAVSARAAVDEDLVDAGEPRHVVEPALTAGARRAPPTVRPFIATARIAATALGRLARHDAEPGRDAAPPATGPTPHAPVVVGVQFRGQDAARAAPRAGRRAANVSERPSPANAGASPCAATRVPAVEDEWSAAAGTTGVVGPSGGSRSSVRQRSRGPQVARGSPSPRAAVFANATTTRSMLAQCPARGCGEPQPVWRRGAGPAHRSGRGTVTATASMLQEILRDAASGATRVRGADPVDPERTGVSCLQRPRDAAA